MIETILWVFLLFFFLFLNLPQYIKALLLKKGEDKQKYNDYTHRAVALWASRVLKSTKANITVHGLENLPKDGAMLFVSNHQSNFDIPLLLAKIPVPKGFIAKKELAKVPFISNWMKLINCLFMDRDDMKQSMQIIIDGIKLLKSGYSMVVFPEGTRSKGGPMKEFKAGSFKLATKSKAPIVPVTIDGTWKLFEGNNNRIGTGDINLYIHKPIYTDTLGKEELAELHTTVHDIIEAKLPKVND
jgi:1-acyl-sn-glycerol-3-phosphate acyltransferase